MYSTRADIENKILDSGMIIQLCDDERLGGSSPESTTLIAARVNAAIDQADEEINSILLGVFPLPFNPVPKIIAIISAKKAAYNLYSRRTGEKPDNITKENAWADRMLEKIRTKEILLVAPDAATPGQALVNKTASDRLFSKSRLDKMP